jgi:tetratricopeptide (TPR) repeat protein
VLVQGLVSKPEYNGKCARVLSFDERGGRYVVALDDGQELSLKPECVVPTPPPEVTTGSTGVRERESRRRLISANQQAQSLSCEGNHCEAEQILREVLAVEKPILGAEHVDTITVETALAQLLTEQTRYAEAERMQRKLIDVASRVLGAEHQGTLANRSNLALSLSHQGKYAEAERIQREVDPVQRRVLGFEHPQTQLTLQCLAGNLSCQGKYAEAEQIQRDVYCVQKKILPADHPTTLMSADNIGIYLTRQGKYAEGEQMIREVYASAKRVLGSEHPQTLTTANNLAFCLTQQSDLDKYIEAAELFQAVVTSRRRVLGPAHPETLAVANDLASVRSQISLAQAWTGRKDAPAPATRPAVLPAGTRVLVQGLVSKPEYNGMFARVLSFDERIDRYVVALDDGKELSLKPDCVARAGCAATGCASEEANSVCGRCEAVRYCSRECQQADWKAHKPACAGARPRP